jgi:hypothetical protein
MPDAKILRGLPLNATASIARESIFISYCHRDRRWLERLLIHLKPYDRRGNLDIWDDSRLTPGTKHWQTRIAEAIEQASVSVVLISADFLASDFVAVFELPRLLQKANERGTVVPIFVGPCELALYPELSSFQGLNQPSRPLNSISRPAADRLLAKAGPAIANILQRPSFDVASVPASAPQGVADDTQLFEELQTASITLSLLWAFRQESSDSTLSDLEKLLGIRSRKRAFEAVGRLSKSGWLEKLKISGRTKYHLTKEGARQLERLSASADGPLRRALVREP